MSQDTNKAEKHNESQDQRFHSTLDAVDAMEKRFESLKDSFHQNIQDLAEKIVKAHIKTEYVDTINTTTSTARSEVDCKEFFDDQDTFNRKIKKLAKLVEKSKHFVAFTGAGISTSAGIADYRSGLNTILETGAGKWAKNDAIKQGKSKDIKPAKRKISSFKAIPTASHMALVGLMKQKPNYLKYLISQNCDGLHRRSGIPIHQLNELHGNSTLEICRKCDKCYMRDYRCRNRHTSGLKKKSVHDHKTDRYCTVPNCGGKLYDTIISFGEPLPEKKLKLAEKHSDAADLYLCLGSSLTVTPACDMPENVGYKWFEESMVNKETKHNLVIVNLQKTPLDEMCSLRIFAKIDDVMIGLMKELKMKIPKWYLQRYMKVTVEEVPNRKDLRKLSICGVDIDGINATIFTEVELRNNGQKILNVGNFGGNRKKTNKYREDEYVFNIPKTLTIDNDDDDNEEEKKCVDGDEVDENKGLLVELSFYGHYKEPKLLIQLNEYLSHLLDINGHIVLKMTFDPFTKKWNVGNKSEQLNDENIKKLWSIYVSGAHNEPKDNDNNDDQ